MFRPEILAPAGNLFKLKTAVRYGADAVYLAGQQFGLRSAADNFTTTEIAAGATFAHKYGAKVYVVLNAFLFDEELEKLPAFLSQLEAAKVDALIISDLGVVETARAHCSIPIHLSTQSSVVNSHAARLWKSLGVTRIVLGREVTIEDAARIKQEAGLEVELFIHGAMCMAYSGNCTISNYTAGRDSNRGGCVQSCRFRYTVAHTRDGSGPVSNFFSSKDLQGVAHLERFSQYEIDSLKIEGRMKSALYVATAARAYRAARDAAMGQQESMTTAALLEELDSMSHRDYTTGNLLKPAGTDSVYHQDGSSSHTHDMAGYIVDVEPGKHMAVFLKNPLDRGTPLYMLTPAGGVIIIETEDMKGLTGKQLERGKPNQIILLPSHPKAQQDLLLRVPKHVEVSSNSASSN